MPNSNPPTDHLKETQFKPGQSGNPGGMSKETAALIRENAERASRLRNRILRALEGDSDDAEAMATIMRFVDESGPGEVLRLIKDSEDRGYGAPKQETDLNHTGNVTFKTVYE